MAARLRVKGTVLAGHLSTLDLGTAMAKLSVFNFITLNGYFAAPDGDTSWHRHGEEEAQYSKDSLASNNILIFGRVTYEHMVAFWPTDHAKQMMPDVAVGMNRAEK